MSIALQTSLFDNHYSEPELRPLGLMVQRIPLEHDAWIDVRPGWLSNSDALFERLAVQVAWQSDDRQPTDIPVAVPMLVAQLELGAALPDPVLAEAGAALDRHYSRPADDAFEIVDLRFSRTGGDDWRRNGDGIPPARDEPAPHDHRLSAILSVGAERTLSLRAADGGDPLLFPLGPGDLVVLGGTGQHSYRHTLLPSRQAVGPHISVRFRPEPRR